MKALSFLLFVLLIVNVQPEKKLEKEVAYKGQQVIADLDFASDIELKTWEKSAVKIVASVKMEDEKYKDMYELKVNSNGSKIEICSNTGVLVEAYHDEFGQKNDLKQEINYTLFVPEGVEMELSSVTGSLTSEFLQGNIRIDLVVGDVNIEKFKGNLELKSVTGKIDLSVKDSSYKAKTVMGHIHGNDPAADRKKGFVGQEVTKDLQDSKNRLSLSTVTGDIYLK